MPEAILLEDIESLGQKGSVVEVSKGYLRNYLQPRKLAQPATKSTLAAAQQMIAAAERAREQAALGRVAPEGRDVLVVGVLDLVLAEQARLAPATAGTGLVPPTRGLCIALLRHEILVERVGAAACKSAPSAGAPVPQYDKTAKTPVRCVW